MELRSKVAKKSLGAALVARACGVLKFRLVAPPHSLFAQPHPLPVPQPPPPPRATYTVHTCVNHTPDAGLGVRGRCSWR